MKVREELVIKAKEVNNIVETGKLKINNEALNIKPFLDRTYTPSIEYRYNDLIKIDVSNMIKNDKMCEIVVMDCDSPDAFDKRFDNQAVLNFASSKHPGGGFATGAMAQEESLCQRSNLYSVLSNHEEYYKYNIQHLAKAVYTDGVIYSSDICFFRDAELKNCLPYKMNVISVAAPNRGAARRQQVSNGLIEKVMYNRIGHIITVAILHKTEHLILGAFGCGVFKNDPERVALMMKDIIVDKGYGHYFKKITFAMHDSDSKNSKTFHRVFD